METVWALLTVALRELTLFAAVGFLIGGIDDLIIDLLWLWRALWRRVAIHSHYARATADSLASPHRPGRIAVFVPAWHEADVIAAMLRHALTIWGEGDYRIYVGTYPNDPATTHAVQSLADRRVRTVIGPAEGPTTKADCLNALWHALIADEATGAPRAKAIVLHDAEDLVHPAELRVFDTLIERAALVQLPVMPLIDRRSRWIGGHYNDEFAEAHGKTLVVREFIGAGIPSAGVGCAFARDMLDAIASARGSAPFDQDSLTEDYELGLRIAARGGRGVFVRLPTASGQRATVAVRAHFPATFDAATRQKARWISGIALSGWDRLGWNGGFAERWMRLHDRRAPLAALVLLAAYGVLALSAVMAIGLALGVPMPAYPPIVSQLLSLCSVLLVWRLAVRCFFVTRAYGWAEGLRAVPRAVIGNVIAIVAARRAFGIYLRARRQGSVWWDKTAHQFPDAIPDG